MVEKENIKKIYIKRNRFLFVCPGMPKCFSLLENNTQRNKGRALGITFK